MVRASHKNPRDVAQLSGKLLEDTIEPSLALSTSDSEQWVTSRDLTETSLPYVPEVMDSLTIFLLTHVNIKSSILFRADIVHDSLGLLKTPKEKEQAFNQTGNNSLANIDDSTDDVEPRPAREIPGFNLTRTVVRRFIPRNSKLDRPMEQTCHFYEETKSIPSLSDGANTVGIEAPAETSIRRYLVVYTPHASKEDMPFYHPLLQALAFLYDYDPNATSSADGNTGSGTLSIHFVLFPEEPIQKRLERTLHSLLNNQIRLARNTRLDVPAENNNNPNKDNILPRHLVQDTYARLKWKYGPDLCERWVESTDPTKHVFEDLLITAFLIELWRNMYGVVPAEERDGRDDDNRFPGFVDVACGNGLLVYVLIMEGYRGWGFDARQRKTWSIFPESVQSQLKEEIYIPQPFVDEFTALGLDDELLNLGIKYHSGRFPQDTFIISNHADELTPWTPLMAAQAHPGSPLPFIAIPCCSHSLSGARYRYPPPKGKGKGSSAQRDDDDRQVEQNPQPVSGDLKALRKAKEDALTDKGFYKSQYGSLTAKTVHITEEIGCEVETTLLRIPSTRNMAVIGNRKCTIEKWGSMLNPLETVAETDQRYIAQRDNEVAIERVNDLVHRECSREGGISAAAKIWIERAKGLNRGAGKGGGH
ncbi:tRNA(Ser) Um(44) 2'-O-methyltransferase [Aspergillus nanangensis]|uniref:tRNA (uracil-O(2)-)-methyltransferase n=1 Tax=Aspergillus nanangensis TaxID=2582783 RepID=A0AAD4GPS6_ASPNN|nr:tRNA(Ser) Um(44) 2'-O-methyltransferase [Aspergillus nanangensis]